MLLGCSLSGSFHLPIHHYRPQERLSVLDISDNEFSGSIPPQICAFLTNIKELYLSNNQLSGKIQEQLSNCSSLMMLDARNNALSGEIPRRIWDMPHLTLVDLSSNSFLGSLPPGFISPRMQQVHLSRNKLGGTLSRGADDHHAISNVEKKYADLQLQALDLGHNHFMGTLPKWIAELPQLTHLLLNNNQLQGAVLAPLCLQQLKFIDVSDNRLSGHLSSALTYNCSTRRKDKVPAVYGPQFVIITTLYPYKGESIMSFSVLDFSNNSFTGEIPPQINHLYTVQVLNLSYNMLAGPIPQWFSNLIEIEVLDISHNNLSGAIPDQLTELSSLSSFSVAFNNLSGRCPPLVNQFATFDEDSYQGNPLLICASPTLTPPATTDEDHGEEGEYIDMECFYASGGVSFVMALLIIASVLYINPYWRRVWFYYVGITITTCYYFVVDHLPVPIRYKVWEPRV